MAEERFGEPIDPQDTEKWDSDPAGMMEYYKNQQYTLGHPLQISSTIHTMQMRQKLMCV